MEVGNGATKSGELRVLTHGCVQNKEKERRDRRLLTEYADGLGMWRRR